MISCSCWDPTLSVEDTSPRFSSVSCCLLTAEAERRDTPSGTSTLALLGAGGRGVSVTWTASLSTVAEDASACG